MTLRRREFTHSPAAGVAFHPGTSYDVAVIGAGVFGAWTAWHLQRAGKTVLLLDAYGPAHNRASSGGESRIIRMGYGAEEIYTRWAMRSLALWREFFIKTRQPLFHQTGVLWFAGENDAHTEATRRTLETCGARFELLREPELSRRYPQISFSPGMWAILEPESGALIARRAVQAVVEDAVAGGLAFLQDAVLPPTGKGVLAGVATLGGETIRAGAYVFACGPWLPKIFPDLLQRLIYPTRQEVFFFGVPPGNRSFSPSAFPVWIDFSDQRAPYGFPDLESRGIKLAFDHHGPPFDPDTGNRQISAEGLASARKFIAGRFPALRDAPLVESRVCQYENTFNGDFLIDRHPAWSNVWLAGGGSGHGFKHGPAFGEYTAARVLGEDGPVEPRFSLATKAEFQKRSVF